MEPEVTAAQLAAFDQAYAHSSKYVDELIDAFRANVDQTVAEGYPKEVSIFALSRHLLEHSSYASVCSALAVAVVRLDGLTTDPPMPRE
jgi:hypothetical protein